MTHTSAFLLKFIDFSVEALQRFRMFLLHKKDRTFCILELYASLSQSSRHSEYHLAIGSDENEEINIKIPAPNSIDHIFNMAASPLPRAAESKYFFKKPWQTGFVTISSLRHHFLINEHFSLVGVGPTNQKQPSIIIYLSRPEHARSACAVPKAGGKVGGVTAYFDSIFRFVAQFFSLMGWLPLPIPAVWQFGNGKNE